MKISEPIHISEINVLIIDGQTFAHELIKSALLPLGVTKVKSAYNSYYALRLCETIKFDMVLIAFDVKSDKDGFNLLEEMKFKGFITNTTIVVFLSSDTSVALVNCVVELQPNDFWVKPLDRSKVEKRIRYVIEFQRKLHKLQYCFDQGKFTTAIYLAERHVSDLELKPYHPQINRLIGRALFLLCQYEEAERFYRQLSEHYQFAWVLIELARTLFKQSKMPEAFDIANALLERDDGRFSAYDLLAEYYIANENYEKGYEIIKEATKLAPRNIERNKKYWNLARLNHDRMGQYAATKNMARYAKNSIHDSPDLSLNVFRAALDLASTLPELEGNKLLLKTEQDLTNFETKHALAHELKNALTTLHVRLRNSRHDKKGAIKLLKDELGTKLNQSFEDNLDKMKAYHELGYWEESITQLEHLLQQTNDHSFTGKVLEKYVQQESIERKDIKYSTKELSIMASAHYKNRRYKPAYESLCQALQLSPRNSNIGLTVLKVLVKLAEDDALEEKHKERFTRCSEMLSQLDLSVSQQLKLNEYKLCFTTAVA